MDRILQYRRNSILIIFVFLLRHILKMKFIWPHDKSIGFFPLPSINIVFELLLHSLSVWYSVN